MGARATAAAPEAAAGARGIVSRAEKLPDGRWRAPLGIARTVACAAPRGACLGTSRANPGVPWKYVTRGATLLPGAATRAVAGVSPAAIVARPAATATPSPPIRVRFTRYPFAEDRRVSPVAFCTYLLGPVHPRIYQDRSVAGY